MNTEGEVALPPAEANFIDILYRGEKWTRMLSNSPNITFLYPGKPKPELSQNRNITINSQLNYKVLKQHNAYS